MIKTLLILLVFPGVLYGAPGLLSNTGLFANIVDKKISPGLIKYEPQYPLWTDGARKQRWLSLPAGGEIDSSDPDDLIVPVGTKIWKEFSFPRPTGRGWKRVETRLMEKVSATKWAYSTYLWNENESEAKLAPPSGVKDYFPTSKDTKHNIPSEVDCKLCHRTGGDPLLGFTILQLSEDRDSLSPHQAPLDGAMSLGAMVAKKIFTHGVPLKSKVHAAKPIGRAAAGYLMANCGSCHNPGGTAAFTGMLTHVLLGMKEESELPLFQTVVNQPASTFFIPGVSDTFRLKAGAPDKSAIIFRMKDRGIHRMPQTGTKLVDTKAVALLEEWIRGL